MLTVQNALVKEFCTSLNLKEFAPEKNLIENQFNCLVLFILAQLQNSHPSLKSYIKTIPQNFLEYPLFFMEAELPKMKNTLLENRYNREISDIKKIKELIPIANKKSNLTKGLDKNFTLAEIKHAYIAVASRNFGIKLNNTKVSYSALAPFTDMFNYEPKLNNTIWSEDLKDENDFFTLKANKNIAKGKQIFIWYGEDDNSKLLFDYGFTLKKNPFKLSNGDFLYTHKGKNYTGSLQINDAKNLIEIVNDYKEKNNLKFSKNEKEKKNDLEVFRSVLKSLKKYSNKKRIEEYKKNKNQNPNYVNIYRVLVNEDTLMDANIKKTEEIIQILEGGKQKLKEKTKSKVVKQNLKYFENLLK